MTVEGIIFVSLFLGFCIVFFGMIFIAIAGLSEDDFEEIARMTAQVKYDKEN